MAELSQSQRHAGWLDLSGLSVPPEAQKGGAYGGHVMRVGRGRMPAGSRRDARMRRAVPDVVVLAAR